MKKGLALLLGLTLAMSVFTGCTSGGAEAPQTSDAPAESAEAPAESAEAPESEAPAEEANAEGGGDLVIYSPNSEDMINVIVPLFEKETGIKVELISMGSGELFTRVESEKNSPNADVAWGGGRATYYNNLGLFEDYTSANNDSVMDEYKNDTNKITLYCLDGSCLLVNKDLTEGITIEGYADLLNPELKGKISMGDPANSSSAFAQLTNMLLAMGGDYTSDAGWKYVEDLLVNTEGKIASSSSQVHKSVADGENAVALTYEDPAASYMKSGAENLEVVYPTEGSVYLPAGSGIIKGAKNMENAKLFMDFIVSATGQDAFGTQLTVRPVSANAALGDYMTPLSDIKLIYEDYDYVQENKDAIVEHYMDLYTTIAE
ncbi:MAG: extracellular solute-binding protein [Clostridiales bacterium]|jgi:iron(III) transport system substrate-binding protein|nr:extracellular solute-binding protein [Clostridiales bacterium]